MELYLWSQRESRWAVRLLICPDLINNERGCRSDCVFARCFPARLQIHYDIYRDPQPLADPSAAWSRSCSAKIYRLRRQFRRLSSLFEAQKLLICQSRQVDLDFDCFGLRWDIAFLIFNISSLLSRQILTLTVPTFVFSPAFDRLS